MGIREDKKQQTNQKILKAVRELVNEKNYDSITIREIAARAGISIGAYYKHFNSKDDIIFQQMDKSYLNTAQEIAPHLNKKSAIENINYYLERQYEILGEIEIPWLREVFRIYLYHKIDEILDKKSINYQVIFNIVQQGQKDGTIRQDITDESLAWMVLKSIIANFYCYCMQEGDFDLLTVMKQEVYDLVKGK